MNQPPAPARPGVAFGGRRLLVVVAALILAAWGGRWGYHRRSAARQAEAGRLAMARGDYATASAHFAAALAVHPADDEAAYRLGLCEQERGRLDAALAAWEKVGPDSPFAALAASRTAPVLLERGRYARAEELLRRAVTRPGPQVGESREMLARVLRMEDRRDEAREVLRQSLRDADDLGRVLRDLWLLDSEGVAVERTRQFFGKAARDAPGDDRVGLALANLDRRAGRLDEAEARLRKCLDARPDDPAVWRAWLLWAQAAGRPAEVRRAAGHLPAARWTERDVLELRAWLAGRSGDPAAERGSLEALERLDPPTAWALERLAVLDTGAGRPDRAVERRKRKAELVATRERYDRLMEEPDARLRPRAAELARLAESLGRHDDAQGWWRLALRDRPGDDTARQGLARVSRPQTRAKGEAGATLADLVNDIPVGSTPPTETAAGANGTALPRFTDDAGSARLRFVFDHGPTPDRQLPETMSGGVGLLDYDGDGWLDVYCVQGGPLVPRPDRPSPGDRLFRNRGNGTFEDVTERSGLASFPRGYGHGVAVGDVDNDGRPDVFVTRFDSYALYRNRGDGTFEDRTGPAGLAGPRGWPTSAAFADLDADGDLDLYVCHYLRWDPSHPTRCLGPETKAPEYCSPKGFEAEPDRLFRNDGGRFVDVSAEAGVVDRDGRGLGVVAADLDADGRVDLFVANDTTANLAFFNEGGLRFREAGLESGLAANATSGFLAGMGVACADADGDGRPDVVVTNFYDEGTTFYRNLGGGSFADHSAAAGTTLASRYLLGFGVAFADVDNDGRPDLITADGHVNDSRPLFPYAMPTQLLLNRGGARFADVTAAVGPPLTVPRVGRGLAVGDLDNDGRLDLVLVSLGEPLVYLHNRTEAGHSLRFRLEATRTARDAVGARVVVTAGGRSQTGWVIGGGSYLSASDRAAHFGLGTARRADRVEVHWPGGRVDRFEGVDADAAYHLREGDPPRRLR